MLILDRLIGWAFLRLFLITVLGVPLLFIVADLTGSVDSYIEREFTVGEVMLYYYYQLPQFLLWSFPVGALVAAVFTVNSMTQHREIVAIKSGGVSFHRIVAPLLLLGAILAGVALVEIDSVPAGNRKAARMLNKDRSLSSTGRGQFVYKSDDGRSITASQLTGTQEDAQIHRLVIESGDPLRDSVTLHLFARWAFYSPERGWTLSDGLLRRVGPGDRVVAFQFDTLWSRHFTEAPADLVKRPPEADFMTLGEIRRQADALLRSGGNPLELLVKMNQRIALAVGTLVVILFAAPLATTAERGGPAFGIGTSLASTILYILLFRLSGAVGEAGGMDPAWAAWLPNGVFFVVGAVLLVRVRT